MSPQRAPAPPNSPAVSTPAPMQPGDEAPAGTPGAGENLCPHCVGSGRVNGKECLECQGTGIVISGVGGA